jgi:hypothetical protein
MPILTQPAFGPRTALIYVTVGALIDVWTMVWYFTRTHDLSRTEQFWVIGLALTGLTFVLLGLFLGQLGRAARRSELPPVEASQAEASIQQTAAANPPAVATGVPGAAPAVPAAPAAPVAAQPPAPPGAVIPPPTVRVT